MSASGARPTIPVDPALDDLTGAPEVAVPVRIRRLGERTLVADDAGNWALLDDDALRGYLGGTLSPDDAAYETLRERDLIAGSLDERRLIDAVARRTAFLHRGPAHHVIVPTLRGDVAEDGEPVPLDSDAFDMTEETADRVVDTIFLSPNPQITIDLHGVEPAAAWERLIHILDYIDRKNRLSRKSITVRLSTSLRALGDDLVDELLGRQVLLRPWLLGPADLHDAEATRLGAASHADTVAFIARVHAHYEAEGLGPDEARVRPRLAITERAAGRGGEIAEAYLAAGCTELELPPPGASLSDAGVDAVLWLDVWRGIFDRLLQAGAEGARERTAATLLRRILPGDGGARHDDPGEAFTSPSGEGIRSFVYGVDGSVYTADAGRQLHQRDPDEDLFCAGNVNLNGYNQLLAHDAVRASVVASTLEGQPEATTCAYLPFVGASPAANYLQCGSLAGRLRESAYFQAQCGVCDTIFDTIAGARPDPRVIAALRGWAERPPLGHFIRGPQA